MIRSAMLLISTFVISVSVFAGARYPRTPDLEITPGDLCSRADSYRYPERIPYCNRDVSSNLKREIMKQYDDELGYQVTRMPRSQFKIDHFIPLCMGGSNGRRNLWPQHESIYKQTDELEFVLCEKMKAGRLKQVQAVEMIREAKFNVKSVEFLRREALSY